MAARGDAGAPIHSAMCASERKSMQVNGSRLRMLGGDTIAATKHRTKSVPAVTSKDSLLLASQTTFEGRGAEVSWY